ncbi:hypothetical protein [Sulfurimonas sp.]
MTGFLIFIAIFVLIPVALYISAKNQFGEGTYNKEHDKKSK